MAERRVPIPDYLTAHTTMEVMGKHYSKRAKELIGKVDGKPSMQELLAITYLMGIVDMAAAYSLAIETSGVDDMRRKIDAAIEAHLSGNYD